jgi:glycerol kinase
MSTILAIDQSTSGTKAILFDDQGVLLDQVALPHCQIYPQPGWVEHDPEEIYQNTLQAVRILLDRNPAHRQRLLCLSLTNQRETIVVFDRASGRPLYNAIVWQCRRGAALCETMAQLGYDTLVQERTGLKIDTYFSAPKLRWLVENEPGIAQKLQDGQALVGTIDAYLIYRLTGGQTFASDHTNASRTLLYNIHTLGWDAELCELFRVPQQALPEVRDVNDRFGATDLGGYLDQPLPICGVMGDSQAALFGQRGYTPGAVKITFGSGSSILLNIGKQPRQPAQGVITALAWVIDGQPTYSFEGITNFTGATVNWLRDQLKLIETPEETETLALSVADNGGVYLVNAFVGLSAPYWRPEARAAILGLTPASTRAHVARAALEAIGYLISDVLQAISQQGGVQLQGIHADGGGSRNRFLMQFVADMTRLQVRAARLPELSALGAALAGGLGMGLYASLDTFQQLPLEFEDYQPVLPGEQAATLYAGWQHAVRQVLAP